MISSLWINCLMHVGCFFKPAKEHFYQEILISQSNLLEKLVVVKFYTLRDLCLLSIALPRVETN